VNKLSVVELSMLMFCARNRPCGMFASSFEQSQEVKLTSDHWGATHAGTQSFSGHERDTAYQLRRQKTKPVSYRLPFGSCQALDRPRAMYLGSAHAHDPLNYSLKYRDKRGDGGTKAQCSYSGRFVHG
jgi:hypothetical protein